MNFRYLFIAMALAVAMVDGNPFARRARAVAVKAAAKSKAAASAPKAAVPAPAPKAPAAVAASTTPAVTVPKMLPAIVDGIKKGTAPKTGVAGLDDFTAAVTTASNIKGKPTAKQLADFGTKAVTSLSTATKATKDNQAKLQMAVTNGLKVSANQNVEGVVKIIGNNANLLGASKAVTPVLQKLMPVTAPTPSVAPAGPNAITNAAMSNLLANVPNLFNNNGDPNAQRQLANQFAQGTYSGGVDVNSLMNSLNQQNAAPASTFPGLANFQSQLANMNQQASYPLLDMSSIMNSMNQQNAAPASMFQGLPLTVQSPLAPMAQQASYPPVFDMSSIMNSIQQNAASGGLLQSPPLTVQSPLGQQNTVSAGVVQGISSNLQNQLASMSQQNVAPGGLLQGFNLPDMQNQLPAFDFSSLLQNMGGQGR